MRLDHLIATVPDIRATHARLLAMGFEEAWPVGPFWPEASTSGIALGDANLELVQPDAGVAEARIDTLVLAPSTIAEGLAMAPVFEERGKVESDPALLALRGFPPELTTAPQTICVNLYPDSSPYPFFLCLYAPFLKDRLAPRRFRQPRGPLVGLVLRAWQPDATQRLFAGCLGPIALQVDLAEETDVVAIRFADGSSLSASVFRIREACGRRLAGPARGFPAAIV